MSNFLQIPDLNLSHQGKVRDIFEVKNQKYTLKNLSKSFQEMLTLDELIKKLIK